MPSIYVIKKICTQYTNIMHRPSILINIERSLRGLWLGTLLCIFGFVKINWTYVCSNICFITETARLVEKLRLEVKLFLRLNSSNTNVPLSIYSLVYTTNWYSGLWSAQKYLLLDGSHVTLFKKSYNVISVQREINLHAS